MKLTFDQWVAATLRRPEGLLFWGAQDYGRTWGRVWEGVLSGKQVEAKVRAMTKRLGAEDSRTDSSQERQPATGDWHLCFLRDGFAGRRDLYMIIVRVKNEDGTPTEAARKMYGQYERDFSREEGT